ncbi:MAG: LysM peptidoglycan-binding domain-containing protein [Phycisphaera sp. TMED9]|nr:LysM peptidoglycan-binding domain-containing protein [bacterium]RPG19719.1 MAG: LysM peptidoglycan-binding domain-containing protein [Phycisphaera sp. TMED9]
MTRDHKLALVVGFGLILFVGILITDHLTTSTRLHDSLPTNSVTSEYRPPSSIQASPNRAYREPEANASIATIEPRPQAEITFNTPKVDSPEITQIARANEISGRIVAEPTRPATVRPLTHEVASGETLQSISTEFFGTTRKWKAIADANRNVLPNADDLRVGMVLVIPDRNIASSTRTRTIANRSTTSDAREIRVLPGDSLSRIAKRELEDQSRWRDIQTLNGLSDTQVHPGQVLKIPAR